MPWTKVIKLFLEIHIHKCEENNWIFLKFSTFFWIFILVGRNSIHRMKHKQKYWKGPSPLIIQEIAFQGNGESNKHVFLKKDCRQALFVHSLNGKTCEIEIYATCYVRTPFTGKLRNVKLVNMCKNFFKIHISAEAGIT